MSLAQQQEVNRSWESLHETTKELDSSWHDHQITEDDAACIENSFQKVINSGDLLTSNPNELINHLQSYNSGWNHPYSVCTMGFSSGQTKEGVVSQNGYPELTSPSGEDVSMKVLQAKEDRDCLEAVNSRQLYDQGLLNEQLQSSSSERAILASTVPCRSELADGHPHHRLNPDGSVLHIHASVGVGGTKKVRKRSRPSRKPPTTILEADSVSFRSVVQKLTGIPSSSYKKLPGLSADLSSFRQYLLSESPAAAISVNRESPPELHPFKYPFGDTDDSIPVPVQKPSLSVGISDTSIVQALCMGRSCSMKLPQAESSQCSSYSSDFSTKRPSQ